MERETGTRARGDSRVEGAKALDRRVVRALALSRGTDSLATIRPPNEKCPKAEGANERVSEQAREREREREKESE